MTNFNQFEQLVESRGCQIVEEYNGTSILYGLVVSTDSDDVDSLKALPGVEDVWLNEMITIPDCSLGPC